MSSSKRVGTAFLATVCGFYFLSMTGVGSYFGTLGSIILSQLAVFLPVVWCVISAKKPVTGQLSLYKMKLVDIGLSILYCVCVYFVLQLASSLASLFSSDVSSDSIIKMSEQIPFWLCALLVAVIPAVAEELMFRGLLYTQLKKTSPLWAVILCSVLFGILHGNLNQFTYTVLAGFMFVMLVEATGSICSSIIVHCIINLRSVIIVYALPYISEKTGESIEALTTSSREAIIEVLPQTAINAACGAFCGIMILRYLSKRNGRTNLLKGSFKKRAEGNDVLTLQAGVFTTPMIAGTAMVIIYMVLTELSIRGLLN